MTTSSLSKYLEIVMGLARSESGVCFWSPSEVRKDKQYSLNARITHEMSVERGTHEEMDPSADLRTSHC